MDWIPGTNLDDVVHAILFLNKIGVAPAIHRRWSLFLCDFVLFTFLKKWIAWDRRWTAGTPAIEWRSGHAVFSQFP